MRIYETISLDLGTAGYFLISFLLSLLGAYCAVLITVAQREAREKAEKRKER